MHLFKNYRLIFLLLGIAIVIRVFLFTQVMNTPPFSDYFDYKAWIYTSYSDGFAEVYQPDSKTGVFYVDQPPGTMYILTATYNGFLLTAKILSKFFGIDPNANLWINDILLVFFVRLPSIIADLLFGFFIYLFVKDQKTKKLGLIAASFFLFNPAIIYNSTIWGQLDSINNLFFFISLFFLIRKNIFLTIFFLGLSIFVKFSLLPLTPLYLLILLLTSKNQFKKIAISTLATSAIFLILTTPFFQNPFTIFSFALIASGGRSQAITVNAFNFWWLIFNTPLKIEPPQISTLFLNLKLSTWGGIIFTVFYVPLIYKAWVFAKSKQLSPETIALLLSLAACATFLFMPKMHERYLYPALPFLIAYVAIKNKFWIPLIIISLLHFLNLYIVWNPNLFLFGPLEDLTKSQLFLETVCASTIAIFIFFYTKVLFAKKAK